jgi:hypothetical protein
MFIYVAEKLGSFVNISGRLARRILASSNFGWTETLLTQALPGVSIFFR